MLKKKKTKIQWWAPQTNDVGRAHRCCEAVMGLRAAFATKWGAAQPRTREHKEKEEEEEAEEAEEGGEEMGHHTSITTLKTAQKQT
jgi:hypothetical protein